MITWKIAYQSEKSYDVLHVTLKDTLNIDLYYYYYVKASFSVPILSKNVRYVTLKDTPTLDLRNFLTPSFTVYCKTFFIGCVKQNNLDLLYFRDWSDQTSKKFRTSSYSS